MMVVEKRRKKKKSQRRWEEKSVEAAVLGVRVCLWRRMSLVLLLFFILYEEKRFD